MYTNKEQRQEPEYKVGDKVYLKTKDLRLWIKQKGRSAKFYPHYVSPFEISLAEPVTSNYTLKLPSEFRIHPKFHARRLKLAHDNDPELFPGRIPPKLPPIDADDNQWAVEAILDHRKQGRNWQFLVHWEGYRDMDDCWVQENDIDQEMVRAYFEELEKDQEVHKGGNQNAMP